MNKYSVKLLKLTQIFKLLSEAAPLQSINSHTRYSSKISVNQINTQKNGNIVAKRHLSCKIC